jgi:hypothetical protein
MKFLAKTPDSCILQEALVYKAKGGHNDRLLALLRAEQRGYCAYTEKRLGALDTCAVEHFDRRLKNTAEDGYYNYYATLQSANQRKRRKERRHENASFFTQKFFQVPRALEKRIRYVAEDCVYEEIDPGDDEARALIDYLGFNDPELQEERRKHVARVCDFFASRSKDQQLDHLRAYPADLSFPTALAAALQLDLDPLL